MAEEGVQFIASKINKWGFIAITLICDLSLWQPLIKIRWNSEDLWVFSVKKLTFMIGFTYRNRPVPVLFLL